MRRTKKATHPSRLSNFHNSILTLIVSKVNRSRGALSSEIKFILMPTPIDFPRVACCVHDYDDIGLLLLDKGLEAASEMTEIQRYELAAAECEVSRYQAQGHC